jgi:hypothetical protein
MARYSLHRCLNLPDSAYRYYSPPAAPYSRSLVGSRFGGASQGKPDRSPPSEPSAIEPIYLDAARDYLTRFSNEAFSTLHHFETKAEAVLNFPVERESLALTEQHHQRYLLETTLEKLNQQK